MRLKTLLPLIPSSGASMFFTAVFFLFFAGLCCYVYAARRRDVYKHLENLPLEEN